MAKYTFRNDLGELVEIPEVAGELLDCIAASRVETPIALSTKLEDLLDRMQTPEARKGMEAAFNATPAELGQAAAKAARRR